MKVALDKKIESVKNMEMLSKVMQSIQVVWHGYLANHFIIKLNHTLYKCLHTLCTNIKTVTNTHTLTHIRAVPAITCSQWSPTCSQCAVGHPHGHSVS